MYGLAVVVLVTGIDIEKKLVVRDAIKAGVGEDRVAQSRKTIECNHPQKCREGTEQHRQFKRNRDKRRPALVGLPRDDVRVVDRIVRAEGRIIAAARSQIVQHLEGGIVSEILVREGQAVKAGDVLMRLSDVQASTTAHQSQSKLWSLKAQQARLNAEAKGLPYPTFSNDIPQAFQQLEMNAFRERNARTQSEMRILRQQVSQRLSELSEVKSRIESLATEFDLARKQSGLMEGLYKKGAASQMELLDAQGRTQRLSTQYNDASGSIARLQSAVAEANARLEESNARARADVHAELSQVSTDISRFGFAVDGYEDRLARTEVRAPAAGFVNRLYFNTIGGVAKPG